MTDEIIALTATDSIGQLFSALGITRVVCVDDIYSNPQLDETIVEQEALSDAQLLTALPEIGSVPDDKDVRKAKVREAFSRLSTAVSWDRVRAIRSSANPEGSPVKHDDEHAAVLRTLVGGVELITLSPTEWKARESQLLNDALTVPTLFLFDQDFSKDDNGSATGGTLIISTLLAKNNDKILCGLLTHTVTMANQYADWERLSKDFNLDRDRFLVIPKECLGTDPNGFARMLKLIALSADFRRLKKCAKEILEAAHAKAAQQVEEVSVIDFEHIIFQVPSKEGIWEPEMLFRLFALYHRLEARTQVHGRGDLVDTVQKLRALSEIPAGPMMAIPPNSWKIQQQELYENSEHLGVCRLPLELGDIFVKTGSTSSKAYILLAQPCDLMIRPSGKRSPEVQYFPLAEIAQFDGKVETLSPKIPYFGETPDKEFVVKLKRIHYVNPDILDLCVFNDDGAAVLDLEQDVKSVRPAWLRRFKSIQESFKKCVKSHDVGKVSQGDSKDKLELKDSLRSNLLKSFSSGPFKLTIAGNSKKISYDCKRVRRLVSSRAAALLMDYAISVCRPAFDRDFGLVDAPPCKDEHGAP